MSDLTSRINELADETNQLGVAIANEVKATRNMANGLSVTSEKVALGIDASTDIDAIKAELAAIKAAVGGTRQFDRQWVEDGAGSLLLQVSNLNAAGAGITTIYMDLAGAIAVPSGAVRPVRIGRASAPAPSWDQSLSDSEWLRRFYRLMIPAPGTIFRSTVTAVNAGNTDMTGLGLPSTQRLVITRLLIQSLSDVRNTAVLRSIGTTSSNLESYRLAGDGSGVSEVRTPHTFIRGAAGANISINLAVAAPGGVYAQIQWYLEDAVTGLPVV